MNDYISVANEYYSKEVFEESIYQTSYGNAEELARASVLLRYAGEIVEGFTKVGETPKILDVGCGRGWLTKIFSQFGDCEGIEPADGSVEFARKLFPEQSFYSGTVSDLLGGKFVGPDRRKFYDIVVCSEVIEHVPWLHKEEFVSQIFEALKNDGHLLITTPRGELFDAFRKTQTSMQPVEDWLTEAQLLKLCNQSGFEAICRDRAYPMKLSKLSSFFLKFNRSPLDVFFRHFWSIYQVWCFKKKV